MLIDHGHLLQNQDADYVQNNGQDQAGMAEN